MRIQQRIAAKIQQCTHSITRESTLILPNKDNFVETGPVVGRVSDVSLLQNSITKQKHHSKWMYDSKRQCKIAGFLVGKTRDVSTAPLVRVLTNLVTSYYRRPFTIRKKRFLLINTVFHFA